MKEKGEEILIFNLQAQVFKKNKIKLRTPVKGEDKEFTTMKKTSERNMDKLKQMMVNMTSEIREIKVSV